MKRFSLIVGLLIVTSPLLAWQGTPEVSKVIINSSDLPTADELRGMRIRLTTATGKIVDLVPLVDENPPDVTVYVPMTADDLSYTSIRGSFDDVIRFSHVFDDDFDGLPGLSMEALIDGDAEDIRVIGSTPIMVETVQQGS